MRRRPWLASVGLAAAILLTGSAAAHADPTPRKTVRTTNAPQDAPDAGSRPQTGSTVRPPAGDTASTVPTGTAPPGPMGDQIALKTTQVQTLAEQAKQVKEQVRSDKHNVSATKDTLDLAKRTLAFFGKRTSDDASRAYKNAARVPDSLSPIAREWRKLGKVAPWLTDPDGSRRRTVTSYEDAQHLVADAQKAYDKAVRALQADQSNLSQLHSRYQQAADDLRKLRADNADALAALNARRRAYDKQFTHEISSKVDGSEANPKAVAAVRYALQQVGKPYVWGAEGPDAYDCSGLVFDSYLHVGVRLPRVADDQYRATADRPVALSKLLPGDLVFYGKTPGDSTSIYHVAMYIGGGKVVQAPTFGVPVQVVQLSVGGMYGATRVLPAAHKKHHGPHPTPTPSGESPTPTPSSSGSGSPTPTPSGSGSPSPSHSPTTSPSASSSVSPGPSDSDTPTTNPTPSGSPSPSADPSASVSASSPSSTTSAAAPSASSTAPAGSSSPSKQSTCPSPGASSSPSPTPSPSPSPTC